MTCCQFYVYVKFNHVLIIVPILYLILYKLCPSFKKYTAFCQNFNWIGAAKKEFEIIFMTQPIWEYGVNLKSLIYSQYL